MRYRDAAAAIAHAQLTLGSGMIMLGSARDDEFGKLQKTPAQVGGVGTQSPYVSVPDADAHHVRAVAAGARVVHPLNISGTSAPTIRGLEAAPRA